MCDTCTEILGLLATYETEVCWGPKKRLAKSEIATVCTYVQGWCQRQCMCMYKDPRNYDRFNHLVQGVLWAALELLRTFEIGAPQPQPTPIVATPIGPALPDATNNVSDGLADAVLSDPAVTCDNNGSRPPTEERTQATGSNTSPLESVSSGGVTVEVDTSGVDGGAAVTPNEGEGSGVTRTDLAGPSVAPPTAKTAMSAPPVVNEVILDWSVEEKEQLLQFVTKVFLLNFPHYAAYKHSVHSKLEEITQQEATAISVHCDINIPFLQDPEIPIYLLRNVCFFCDHDALMAMTSCFSNADATSLPFCLARAMITIVCNLKLWMNMAAVVKCIGPLRTSVIRYMCTLPDKDLRTAGTRSLSEFMWTPVKPPDNHLSFDKEGLDLAFKYFTSSTLTMRLAGIANINNHVTMYTELANSEAMVETEPIGLGLADWLINNRIIENIFGPNLHIEIIKQSHVSLNFLAMECCVTNEHVDCMWSAAQLKHCGKQVHDLLLPLIKHLEPGPVMHLYQLLCRLEPREHTEQTLYLTSALLKVLWSNGNIHHTHLAMGCDQHHFHTHTSPFTSVLKGSICELNDGGSKGSRNEVSSSEHSISLESDDDTPILQSGPLCVPHGAKLPTEGAASGSGCINILKSNLTQMHDWPDDQNSFSSSENDSESGDGTTDGRVPVPMLDSDSEERTAEGEEEEEEEEDDEDSGSEEPPRGPSTSVSDRATRERRLLLRRRRRPRPVQLRAGNRPSTPAAERVPSADRAPPLERIPGSPALTSSAARLEPTMQDQTVVGTAGAGNAGGGGPAVNQEKVEPGVGTGRVGGDGSGDHSPEPSIPTKRRKMETAHEGAGPSSGGGGGVVGDGRVARVAGVGSAKSPGEDIIPTTRAGASPVVTFPHMDENDEAKVYECMQYFEQQMQSRRLQHPEESELMDDVLSPDDGTCSSRMSTKSEKNMADFEGEESTCEDELIQLAAAGSQPLVTSPQDVRQHLAHMASMYCTHLHRSGKAAQRCSSGETSYSMDVFNMENVCRPGQTLLWDLLQDETVVKLSKGLALEAEKVLSNLVCWSTDRIIRIKFIEGCLHNLANHKSIYLSLRLLPRLFGSFQQYRGRVDTHAITMWAEKEHHMMELFFNNLLSYTREVRAKQSVPCILYSHQVEIQVRLQFLTCIFSSGGSPDFFRLSLEQVDSLWSCLANDPEIADELFSWMLVQAKNKEQHALGIEALRHIFTEKLPLLQPETSSMTSLNLLQQLSNITRLSGDIEQVSAGLLHGIDQLWGIALRAQSTDVSMAAIQYLNNYYISGQPRTLEMEEEFIQKCMTSLATVIPNLEQGQESSLIVIQRALLLLKTHLETFQRRYAYHLRMWRLKGKGIISHQPMIDRQSVPIRVVCQPAGITEKVVLDLSSTDCVADLRAEITHWWELFQQQHRLRTRPQESEPSQDCSSSSSSSCSSSIDSSSARGETPQSDPSPPSVLGPILGAMLTNGPIRLITQGQELTTDLDERTLAELGFKDMQLAFVSVGAPRPQRKRDDLEPASALPPPPQEKLPSVLLLQPVYFEQLFHLIQQLGELKAVGRGGNPILHTKGHLLSWRVWEILMVLPTCPAILSALEALDQEDGSDGVSDSSTHPEVPRKLLDPQTPHKLMYSLQIIESLAKSEKPGPIINNQAREHGQSDSKARHQQGSNRQVAKENSWAAQFVSKGGLRHLYDIFISGILQKQDQGIWSEWNQDCLAFLMKLIYQLGVEMVDGSVSRSGSMTSELSANNVSLSGICSSMSAPKKKSKKQKKMVNECPSLPKLNRIMLGIMSDVSLVTERLVSILYDAGRPNDACHYKIGVGGRGQVVHYALSLLLSWALACPTVKAVMFSEPRNTGWMQHLLLDDPEPSVRQEVCSSLYRLCLGATGQAFVVPLLNCLIGFLHNAKNMKPARMDSFNESDKDKEPYGPACGEYFWLICRLVDNFDDGNLKQNNLKEEIQLDLDGMACQLASGILARDFLEKRHNMIEDDGLVGLISLCSAVIKHNPPFKFSREGQEFIGHIFDCLFALPSPQHRNLPLCKSQQSRSAAYDLIVELTKGSFDNYSVLHDKLLLQHSPSSHSPYPWDYWPHEDGRSDCGYVGLTNLGATCYMASCMQHLYMMPMARASILSAKCSMDSKHESTLKELQRMFAYLLESERKAYNPRSFCKVYTMDHQPLNTGEQKDMAEFFADLIGKLEEMTPQLKELMKSLFCGVNSNNVVSLDCSHVSRTIEEFYTVRCQVTDMRNLYESLDEVTVKDTLDGDNMYTCSQCTRKVRAEKRVCFKKLPRILCFNTMRYTFNMITMMKEKVNTHFSFPLRLDMSKYTERHLMPDQYKAKDDLSSAEEPQESDEYDLIGVTVHTGTADGGHYYSFIRDRNTSSRDKWFLFNDAEVKPFDPAQIATECFGGEMTSKTYDSTTDKFMDFSFEKTNSAYMLFYERSAPCSRTSQTGQGAQSAASASGTMPTSMTPEVTTPTHTVELPKDLADWIWDDNMQFLQDRNIFEHNYFNFMWQVCGYVPQTLTQHKDVTVLAAKLSTSFVLETLIHAKEKPTMVQWIELLTKHFNSSQSACEWFLDHMAENDWWPVQILIKCPNQIGRQMFQRLCIHVINKLRPVPSAKAIANSDGEEEMDSTTNSCPQCVARFIKKLLSLIEHGANQHTKHLTEYFAFLLEFAKISNRECQFLLSIEAISNMINFYLGHKTGEYVDPVSDEDEEEVDDVLSITEDKCKPVSLEKMVSLIALLVEKSRGDDHQLQLSQNDLRAVAGGKGFPFLCQQIRDNINIRQTCNLLFSLCRWNEPLAIHIVAMIFQSISQHAEQSQPFFKLLSLLVEFVGGPPGMPAFTRLVLQHIWEVAETCPQQCLEWLSLQVPRNKFAHSWVLQNMESWVEHFLIAHNNQRVRNAAAILLVSLIPSSHFKQAFRNARNILSPQKEIPMSPDAILVLHHIYDLLLRLLKRAKHYVDTALHGTTKLVSYFALMTYCLVSHAEKLMFGQYFLDLWQLFQPKLSEPPIAVHHNKQALLIFWYQVCIDCPENVKLIVSNAHVTKNIAFNYILADHEDQEVMVFNRFMLPAYYGLLHLCCVLSRPFTRQLANHQNIQWAFKNITPYPAQYPAAVDDLYKLMRLFVAKYPESSESELKEIHSFKCSSLQLYLSVLDGRACWATLVAVLRILVDSNEDRMFLLCNNGLPMLFEAFQTLHVMYHEATACHVTGDLVELLSIILEVLKCSRPYREGKGMSIKSFLVSVKDRADSIRNLLTLLNSYAPGNLRQMCIDVLRELVLLYPVDSLQIMVPIMTHSHSACQENVVPVPTGIYFPRRGQKPTIGSKASSRPPNPFLQMTLHPNQLEVAKNIDLEYDQALSEFYLPYHLLLDMMCRVAVNNDILTEALVNLSASIGIEGIPLHNSYFPKLWIDVHQAENLDKKYMQMLCQSFFFVDYIDRVLTQERPFLNSVVMFHFMFLYMPKIAGNFASERTRNLVNCLMSSLELSITDSVDLAAVAVGLAGDMLALKLLCMVECPHVDRAKIQSSLKAVVNKCRELHRLAETLRPATPDPTGGIVAVLPDVASISATTTTNLTSADHADTEQRMDDVTPAQEHSQSADAEATSTVRTDDGVPTKRPKTDDQCDEPSAQTRSDDTSSSTLVADKNVTSSVPEEHQSVESDDKTPTDRSSADTSVTTTTEKDAAVTVVREIGATAVASGSGNAAALASGGGGGGGSGATNAAVPYVNVQMALPASTRSDCLRHLESTAVAFVDMLKSTMPLPSPSASGNAAPTNPSTTT